MDSSNVNNLRTSNSIVENVNYNVPDQKENNLNLIETGSVNNVGLAEMKKPGISAKNFNEFKGSHGLTYSENLYPNIADINSLSNSLFKNHPVPSKRESISIWESTMEPQEVLAPVNGHNPRCESQRVYPELKHILSHEDIGKTFVRSYPQRLENGNYDWSGVPSERHTHAFTLSYFDESTLKVQFINEYPNPYLETIYEFKNDVFFIPLDKWQTFIEKRNQEPTANIHTPSEAPSPPTPQKANSVHIHTLRKKFHFTQHSKIKPILNNQKNEKTLSNLLSEKESESWISFVKSTDLDVKDYSLKSEPIIHKQRTNKFSINFASHNPREVLGLYPDEENIPTIKKAYYDLSRQYHPDKYTEGKEIFQTIESAYHKLITELRGSPFSSDNKIPFDLEFHAASAWFSFLKANSAVPFKTDSQKVIDMWSYFKDQLKITLAKPHENNTGALLFKRFLPRVEAYLTSYQILSSLQKLTFPAANLSLENQICFIKESIKNLDILISKFDYSIKNWAFEEMGSLKKISAHLLDRKIAWSRSLTVFLIKNNLEKEAVTVNVEVMNFYRTHELRIEKTVKNAAKDQSVFDFHCRMTSYKFPTKKESSQVNDKILEALNDSEKPFSNEKSPKIEDKRPQTIPMKNPPLIDLLKENIERNFNFFKGIPNQENSLKMSPLGRCVAPIFNKWLVNLPNVASYRKNTNDFGVEILELLLSDADKGLLTKTLMDLIELSNRLGIGIKRTTTQVPVRDYLFRLHTGEVRKQLIQEQIEKGVLRAQSKALYLNEKGFTRTSSEFFKVSLGEQLLRKSMVYALENHFKDFVTKENLWFHAEGGNMFTLTNPKGEVKVLLGRDHLFTTLSVHRQAKSLDEYIQSIPQKIKEQLKDDLKPEKILKIAEEMFAQGMILQNNQSGFVDHDQITNILQEMQNKKNFTTFNKCGDNSFRQTAISMGIIQPFDKSDPEKYRDSVAKYLLQKYSVTKLIAEDLAVNPEDVVIVPQLHYHLDTFLKPGPNHSLFLANFSMCADILQQLITDAEGLGLSQQDIKLLQRYLKTAQKLHVELGSLLEEIEKKIVKAGFPVIPMPGMFMCDEELSEDNSTHHINFINALSGWSSTINQYYYITTSAKIGEKLSDIFQDLFKQFLDVYQPGIEVSFLGGNEGMKQWNDVSLQSGIHCFSFETETASHS
ncbi:MAG: J domain-containing protein [Parachlamydiaceae bacterium]|nr:J domain-containing protein [Parachlamydiaceae bacterium]